MKILRQPGDWRQLLIVCLYLAMLGVLFFVPAARHPALLAAACMFSFFAMTVNHNVMHLGLFERREYNRVLRVVLSFCALFPVSSVIPSHNLVHHHFDDDGQPDWADPHHARFRWNLLNLLHFPNLVGPITFAHINRWQRVKGRADYRRQATIESVAAFGFTAALLAYDFWSTLFFVLVPQLWGARWFLRVNLIQHDGCDTGSQWNHSRNFSGRVLNWFSVNAGYHTIHHNRAGLHFTQLPAAHAEQAAERMHPALMERSLLWYLARTYVLRLSRPAPLDVAQAEAKAAVLALPSVEVRRAEAEVASAGV